MSFDNSPSYFSRGSQDTKILVGERKGYSQAQNSETGVYWQQNYLASIIKILFPEIAKLEWRIFQDKKEDSFEAHTCTHAHSQFRVFCQLWDATSTVHVWIWFAPRFVMFFVTLCTLSTSIIFSILSFY